MSEENEVEVEEVEEVEATEGTEGKAPLVCAKREGYTKARTASGKPSLHSGDAVATALAGLPLDDTYDAADMVLEATLEELHAKYDHLNVGMQRMALGNRIRGALKKQEDGVLQNELIQLCDERKTVAEKAAADAAEEKAAAAEEAADDE